MQVDTITEVEILIRHGLVEVLQHLLSLELQQLFLQEVVLQLVQVVEQEMNGIQLVQQVQLLQLLLQALFIIQEEQVLLQVEQAGEAVVQGMQVMVEQLAQQV